MAVYYLLLAVRLLPAALSGAVSASAAAIELSVKTKPKAKKNAGKTNIVCSFQIHANIESLLTSFGVFQDLSSDMFACCIRLQYEHLNTTGRIYTIFAD